MIVLVGERANGRSALDQVSTDAETRLRHGAFRWGASGKRLMSLGLRWDAAMNLLPQQPTQSARWDKHARTQASTAAMNLVDWLLPRFDESLVVVCGQRATSAFTTYGVEWKPFTMYEYHCGTRVFIFPIPHPSGMCRWWNDVENRERASTMFQAVVSHYEPEHESYPPRSDRRVNTEIGALDAAR